MVTAVELEETARARQMFILGLFVSAVEVYSAVYSSVAQSMERSTDIQYASIQYFTMLIWC